ncbi:protein JINGUBANG-like [Arachis stenosperma]|uniref:protein JINGUBANG-like n=1 Tax=Arachis stenosperma TaxID=217475 RepID=UPI0025AC31AC|nr:protein JINGUBANG-like [Arachis stenosperma]
MGILQCPSCCHYSSSSQHHEDHQQQSHHSNSNNTLLHSESSTSSSLSSQPSLPSVPSLTTSQQLQQQELVTTINGHSSAIFCLALHGKFLYSGSSSSEIRRHRKDTFAPDHNVLATTTNSAVKSMTVFGDKLFTAHQDHKIRVWKIQEQEQEPYKCIATLPTFNDRIWKLFSSKNYVQVRRHKKSTWVHHVDTVSAVAISIDGTLLYSASWDRTFKIWRTSDFKCLESVNAHEDAINALVVSRAGVVYTGSADKKIKIWKKLENSKRHALVGTLEKHKSAVNALALSADGLVLYSGACDRSIVVWEKEKEEEGGGDGNVKMVVVGALRGHTKAILCLVAMVDLVVSGSADNSVRVWRRRGISVNSEKSCYSCLAVLEGHRRPVKCLAVAVESADNCGGDDENSGGGDGGNSYLVYSGSLDCGIRVWRIRVPLF